MSEFDISRLSKSLRKSIHVCLLEKTDTGKADKINLLLAQRAKENHERRMRLASPPPTIASYLWRKVDSFLWPKSTSSTVAGAQSYRHEFNHFRTIPKYVKPEEHEVTVCPVKTAVKQTDCKRHFVKSKSTSILSQEVSSTVSAQRFSITSASKVLSYFDSMPIDEADGDVELSFDRCRKEPK